MSTPLQIVVVTGLSGAGKSTALRVFEDMGYFCVDNLPTPLAGEFAEMASMRSDIAKVALGMDARGRVFGRGAEVLKEELASAGHQVSILFLDASDEALVRRFSESRRPHPLCADKGVLYGIELEREGLWQVRQQADEVIDTTLLSVHQLRRLIREWLGGEQSIHQLTIRAISFGFRYGLPIDADLVFDVRFLPNPYFIPELRPKSGRDESVSSFVLAQEETAEFLRRCVDMLDYLIPYYKREGKSYLTVAVGCTGGRHRSVAVTEALSHRLRALHSVNVLHRDIVRHQAEAEDCQEETP